MKFNFKYKPYKNESLGWDDIDIGQAFYHRYTHNIGIKTSSKAYFCFNDNSYHTRSKLLSNSNSKVYYQIKMNVEVEI